MVRLLKSQLETRSRQWHCVMIFVAEMGTLPEDVEWTRMHDISAAVHLVRLGCHAFDGNLQQMCVGVTVVRCELLDDSIGVQVVYGIPGHFSSAS